MFLKRQHSNTHYCDWNKLLNTTENTYLKYIYVVIKSFIVGIEKVKI